jgi:polyphosphate kinase 2 (PPK2 family)
MICFYHRRTGTIEHYPDPNDPYFEPESWQETIDRIDNDFNDYLQFEKMDSNQGFQVMENFASSIDDINIQNRLFELLSKSKPFAHFKMAVETSKYRQNWFDYKQNANIEWVRQQISFIE